MLKLGRMDYWFFVYSLLDELKECHAGVLITVPYPFKKLKPEIDPLGIAFVDKFVDFPI